MDTVTSPTILLVDNTPRSRDDKHYGLTQRGFHVIVVESGDHALNVLESEPVSVLICDLDAPGIDGMSLMHIALRKNPDLGVILMTQPGNLELAVTAMREGAYDVLERPIRVEKLAAELEKIQERQRIVREKVDLQRQLEMRYGFEGIIGKSASMQRIREQILQIADTQATVLIYGESGTGKELVAHALYMNSSRKDKPFVPLSCSALSEGVIESELFGHERGSFTGAVKTYKGRFELADGGTLFLDEVGELTSAIQVKLLRVLQERQFQRVGSDQLLKTDVRLIAATHRNLEEEVVRGSFREDLYYRLKVVTLTVPPLRDRKEDLPLLIERFIRRFSEREEKPVTRIDRKAFELLSAYHWPGNVRELENCIEGMIVMATGSVLDEDDVPEYIRNARWPSRTFSSLTVSSGPASSLSPDLIRTLVHELAGRHGVRIRDITDDAIRRLAAVDWAKNGYSLRRCLDTMILLTEQDVLDVSDIPQEYLPPAPDTGADSDDENRVNIRVGMTMEEAERELIWRTLKSCDNNKAQTARMLKIGLRTLFRKIKEYRIQ